MNVAQVLTHLGLAAPWDKAAGRDPVGLQLGDPSASAGTVAVCHEVTESVVASVEDLGVDLLVSYHPLLFRPTSLLTAGRSPMGRAFRLIRAGASLAVAHTNFDVAAGGSADALADSLGLIDTTGFGPVDAGESIKVVTFVPAAAADLVADAMAAAGGGSIGNYSNCSYRTEGTGTFFAGDGTTPVTGEAGTLNREPETRIEMTVATARRDAVLRALVSAHPYEEPAFDVYPTVGNLGMAGRVGRPPEPVSLRNLVDRVAGALGDRGMRVSGDPGRSVGCVAVVPGSGASYIGAATAARADVLVTGDVAHHRMVEAADRGLSVIDPGHLATERPGIQRLYALVAGIVPGAVDLTHPADGEGNR
ncbi:MAG TPA: Nif3-like dinuclear metal center hexameric protein [Acidimicrobiia bacterium]|nr:Nif3-like dinuclear metal center hexameric protein [Acidimicrobiia bacterium]